MLTTDQIAAYLATLNKAGLLIVRVTIEDSGARLVVETTMHEPRAGTPQTLKTLPEPAAQLGHAGSAQDSWFIPHPPYNHPGDEFDTVDFGLGKR